MVRSKQWIAINKVNPRYGADSVRTGPMATPMFDHLRLFNNLKLANREKIQGKSAIRRFGAPEEVANAILFLASDDTAYMVGEEILVDGGMSLL